MGGLHKLWKAALVAALAALVGAWFRHREPEIVDEEAPGSAAWPPLAPLPGEATDDDGSAETEPAAEPAVDAEPAVEVRPAAEIEPAVGADPGGAAATWVEPNAEGNCPGSHPVKLKKSSGIFHVPGGLAYERTNADRCYCDADAALADGFRAAKR